MLVNISKEAVLHICATLQTCRFMISHALWTIIDIRHDDYCCLPWLTLDYSDINDTNPLRVTRDFFIRGDNDDGNNPYQLGLLSYGLATAGQNCSYLSHSMHPHFKTVFSLHCVFWDNHIYLCTFNFLLAPKLMWTDIFPKGKLWQSLNCGSTERTVCTLHLLCLSRQLRCKSINHSLASLVTLSQIWKLHSTCSWRVYQHKYSWDTLAPNPNCVNKKLWLITTVKLVVLHLWRKLFLHISLFQQMSVPWIRFLRGGWMRFMGLSLH